MASDDFNRANGSLGANWTALEGTCSIESNKARESDGSTGYHWHTYTAVPFGANQSSEVEIQLDTDDAVILNAENNGGLDGYHGMIHNTNGYRIYRRDNGSFTLLHDGGGSPSGTHTYKLTRSGGGLELTEDGVSKSTASDSTYTGGYPGISPRFANARYDNWVGTGDVIEPEIDDVDPNPFADEDLVTITGSHFE